MIEGKNFLYWQGPEANFVVTEPELVKEILNNKGGAYPSRAVQGYWKKLLGDGLISSTGEKWVKQRKLANHAFNAESLKVSTFFSLKKKKFTNFLFQLY